MMKTLDWKTEIEKEAPPKILLKTKVALSPPMLSDKVDKQNNWKLMELVA